MKVNTLMNQAKQDYLWKNKMEVNRVRIDDTTKRNLNHIPKVRVAKNLNW
jgi:hypothetical protein